MRIAVATRHRDHVGGVETYLERLLPALAARGHTLLLWHQFDSAGTPIDLPPATECRSVASLGASSALSALCDWKPDVVFAQGLADTHLEARLAEEQTAVLFLHSYHGTCVGGAKTHSFPGVSPCSRRMGVGCLLLYYPRRCGGLSAVTMMQRYSEESARLECLSLFERVTVLSQHMRDEAIRHGVPRERIALLPPPVDGPPGSALPSERVERLARIGDPREPLRLLFFGRLEPAKGGDVLIAAAPRVARGLDRPVHLAVVGDGRSRAEWERLAARGSDPAVRNLVEARVDRTGRDGWFAWADLLVMPSRWPEPFGLSGAEAAAAGLPAVAFDVGGIPEWLEDRSSGRLADRGRLDSASLADAIAWAASTPDRLASLSAAARTRACRWSMAQHAEAVESVLSAATSRPALAGA